MNYYMSTKNKELAEKLFPKKSEYWLTDTPDFGYEIHIARRTSGWKTLFQVHRKAYNSVAELESFVFNFEDEFLFYDSYGVAYTAKDFIKELKYLDRNELGIVYEDAAPHINYTKNVRKIYPFIDIKYWEDKDGYDFTEGNFR